MVNRSNYHLAWEFIDYLHEVMQLNLSSTHRYWAYAKHLLLWMDEVPFGKAAARRPTFPAYLADGSGAPLLPMTQKKILETAKRFFVWAKANHPRDLSEVPTAWVESIRLARAAQPSREHAFVTLDEVRKLAAVPVTDGDLVTQRDQAAAALLFLSGMRAGALGSLSLECVDLATRTVRQWPALGVWTKNSKSATTYKGSPMMYDSSRPDAV